MALTLARSEAEIAEDEMLRRRAEQLGTGWSTATEPHHWPRSDR